MRLIPAIDLRNGQVVRLAQGDYDRETRYDRDPLELARSYQKSGADWLHVVDLDAARSGNETCLDQIALLARELDLSVQAGGGVRCLEDVELRLESGVERVVIGSLCVRETNTVCRWLDSLGGETLVAGLDVSRELDGTWMPRAAGWTQTGDTDLFSLLERLVDAGLVHLLCTDIERDGMLGGPAVSLYQSIRERFPSVRLQASGGIGKPSDLEDVARTGADGCIVGRALLEGRIELSEIGRWSR